MCPLRPTVLFLAICFWTSPSFVSSQSPSFDSLSLTEIVRMFFVFAQQAYKFVVHDLPYTLQEFDKENSLYVNVFLNALIPDLCDIIKSTLKTAITLQLEEDYGNAHNGQNPYNSYGQNGVLGNFPKSPACVGLERIIQLVNVLASSATLTPTNVLDVFPDPVTENNKAKFMLWRRTSSTTSLNYLNMSYNSPDAEFDKVVLNKFATTYVICHGWVDHFYPGNWMVQLKDLIYRKYDVEPNMIFIDWKPQSLNIYANKVGSAARTISEQFFYFLTRLKAHPKTRSLRFKNFHFIGHSFGAQIVGIVGYKVFDRIPGGPRIGKVLALDPTDQCYYRTSSFPNFNDSLSIYSGLRVKVIHTNGDLAGTYKKMGHVDIYLNGASTQSGCVFKTNFLHNWEFITFVICSHSRPVVVVPTDFNVEDNNDENCFPLAFRCSSYGDFLLGKCYECDECGCHVAATSVQYNQTGYKEPTYPRLPANLNDLTVAGEFYFLKSNWYTLQAAAYPFCKYIYRIELISETSPNGLIMVVSLKGDSGKMFTTSIDLDEGTATLLSFTSRDGFQGQFKEGFIWYQRPSTGPLSQSRFLSYKLNITYMSHPDPNIRQKYSSELCTDFYEEESNMQMFSSFLPGTSLPIISIGSSSHIVKFTKRQCCESTKFLQASYDRLTPLLKAPLTSQYVSRNTYNCEHCAYSRNGTPTPDQC